MTDEQIVKAFKICNSENLGCEDDCPFIEICKKDNGKLYRAIIDLIKRQQAEIESLEADYENVYKQASADILASIADGGTSCEWCIDNHRAEAVREFAEKLTNIICEKIEKSMSNPNGDNYFITDVYTDIDNLVKEITEKEGGKG
jgi:hypothetical protein